MDLNEAWEKINNNSKIVTGNTTYKTSLTYTFVKQNGTWMLADFLIN